MLASMITCFQMILGVFTYTDISRANFTLGPIFFVLFIILVYFTLANMFLAIINDAYAFVKFHNMEARSLTQALRGQQKPGGLCGGKKKSYLMSDEELLNRLKMNESSLTGVLHIDELRGALGKDVTAEDGQNILSLYNRAQITGKGKGRRKADPETELENKLRDFRDDFQKMEAKVDWLMSAFNLPVEQRSS